MFVEILETPQQSDAVEFSCCSYSFYSTGLELLDPAEDEEAQQEETEA